MIFRRRIYPGISLCSDGSRLHGATLSKQGRELTLSRQRQEDLPVGTLTPAFATPNIGDTVSFVVALQALLQDVAGRENRIALSLPDQVARTYLLDLDAEVGSPRKLEQLARWTLRDSLPGPGENYTLAVNAVAPVVAERGRYLVAVMKTEVLAQYEDCLRLAGYDAAVIDLDSLALRSHLWQQSTLAGAHLLVTLVTGQLGVSAHDGQKLQYLRLRQLDRCREHLAPELRRSYLAALQECSELSDFPVYHCDDSDQAPLLAQMLEEIAGRPSQPLSLKAPLQFGTACAVAERLARGWR